MSSVKSVGPENYPSVGKEIAGQTIVMQKNTHQAHVMIGTRAYDVNDSRFPSVLFRHNQSLKVLCSGSDG